MPEQPTNIVEKLSDRIGIQELSVIKSVVDDLATGLQEAIDAYAGRAGTLKLGFIKAQLDHLCGKQAGYRYLSHILDLAITDADRRFEEWHAKDRTKNK